MFSLFGVKKKPKDLLEEDDLFALINRLLLIMGIIDLDKNIYKFGRFFLRIGLIIGNGSSILSLIFCMMLCFIAIYICNLSSYFYLYLRRRILYKLMNKYFIILKNIQSQMKDRQIALALIEPYYSRAFRFGGVISAFFITNSVLWVANALLRDGLRNFKNEEGTELELTVASGKIYFFDMPSAPVFYFIYYITHWISCVVNCTMMAFFDTFIVTFLLLIEGQVEVFLYQMQNINFGELNCFKKFAACVRHHQNIISLFKDFNSLTDLVLFFASARAVCTISTFSFEASLIEKTDPNIVSIISAIMLYSTIFRLRFTRRKLKS